MSEKHNAFKDGGLTEYEALRAEIISRINLRNQLLVIPITLLGLLLVFAAQKEDISALLFLAYTGEY